MRCLLPFLVLASSVVFSSEFGAPPNVVGLKETLAAADVVVVGKPINFTQRLLYKGKEVTEEEAQEIFDSHDYGSGKPFPRLTTEFTVMLKVSRHLKGSIRNPELILKWQDLTGSMCPHIPLDALKISGIWYTGSHVKEHEHDHAVYWLSPDDEKKVEAVINQSAEQAVPPKSDRAGG